MKKKVFIFLGIALCCLAILPIVNIAFGEKKEKWWKHSNAYGTDLLYRKLSQFVYHYGISVRPGQAIIGKNNWLFLGDDYQATLSTKRLPATQQSLAAMPSELKHVASWNAWLKNQGVHQFVIMIAPDKSTVYPEFLPDWALPNPNNIMHYFRMHIQNTPYLDLSSALIHAKSQWSAPLYYNIDTHWNAAGAWVGYQTLGKVLRAQEKSLRWLSLTQFKLIFEKNAPQQDLARMLYLEHVLSNTDDMPILDNTITINSTQSEVDIKKWGNIETLSIIKTSNALNHKKILWLHDSFGDGLTPFMFATYSDVMYVEYSKLTPEQFMSLVNTFHPDDVIITVIERATRAQWFETEPAPSN